jgi:hypothetical protein
MITLWAFGAAIAALAVVIVVKRRLAVTLGLQSD